MVYLTLEKLQKQFSKWLYYFTFPSANKWEFQFLHILANIWWCLIYFSHPDVSLINFSSVSWFSKITNDVEHFYRCLLAIHMPSLVKFLTILFTRLFYLAVFLLLICWYLVNISFLLDRCIKDIFLPVWGLPINFVSSIYYHERFNFLQVFFPLQQ